MGFQYYDEICDFANNIYSATEPIDGFDFELPLVWDKKRFSFPCIDLKDLALIFKIKEFSQIKSILPDEFEAFEYEHGRLLAWMRTFDMIDRQHLEKFQTCPPTISRNFLSARAALLASLWRWIRKFDMSEDVLDFYQKNIETFETVRKMRYEILTSEGMKGVDLMFAENFRFKPEEDSFNISTLQKNARKIIIPQSEKEFIYAIDFRQFEFRTFLHLANAEVDFGCLDLYSEIGKRFGFNKEEAKLQAISYLYSESTEPKFGEVIEKQNILDLIDDDFFMWGPCPIYVDAAAEQKKKIHTIIQTISYFFYLEKLAQILKMLDGKKSSFIFPLHDSMIFSIHADELDLMERIPELLETDVYKIKQYVGKNFLEMEEL